MNQADTQNGRTNKPKPNPATSPEEIKKREMRLRIREMRKRIDTEHKLVNQFYAEKERLSSNWQLIRRQIEQKDAELVTCKRRVTEITEHNNFSVGLHRERIKQVMLLKETGSAENLLEIEAILKDLEDENRIVEQELLIDNRALGRELKEHEISHHNLIFSMKMLGNHTSTTIRNEFEREANEMKSMYDLKMQKMRQEMEEYASKKILQLEEEKQEKFKELTTYHNNRYRDIKNYYSEIISTNLAKIKDLKGEIQIAQMADEKDRKLLLKAEENFKKLSEPLKMITEEIARLKEDKEKWRIVKEEKKKLRDMITGLEKIYRDIEYEYEIRFQQYKFLDEESKRVKTNFDEKLQEIYQKAGLNNLILEKEISMLKENIDIRDSQVKNLLLGFDLSPEEKQTIEDNIRSVEIQKDQKLIEIKKKLIEIRKAHLQMVAFYHAKLKEHQIPVNELGFVPKLPKVSALQ
jgi:hypothetical protein